MQQDQQRNLRKKLDFTKAQLIAHFFLPSLWTWNMMFEDHIVLSRQNHRRLKEDLEMWRNTLEIIKEARK